MEMKLEVVVLPVTDVDRAKAFYEGLGWRLDADIPGEGGFRVIQLTPPGSECSIILGQGLTAMAPGSIDGLQLTVTDIEAARAELAERGVEVTEPFHDEGGVFHHAGTEGRVPGPDPEGSSYGSFLSFAASLQYRAERVPSSCHERPDTSRAPSRSRKIRSRLTAEGSRRLRSVSENCHHSPSMRATRPSQSIAFRSFSITTVISASLVPPS